MIYRMIAYTLILLGIIGVFYVGSAGMYGDRYEIPSISIESLGRQLGDSSKIIFIDVRTKAEISEKPSPWVPEFEIPLLTLEERCMELTPYKDQQMVLLCPTGNRSRQGARILRLAGFDAYYLNKGLQGINK